MIHIRSEGQVIHPGLNVYPLSDVSSVGVILSFSRKKFILRYSKVIKKWFIGMHNE